MRGFIIAVHLLVSVALIATVLLQSGRSAGLSGSIAGGAETFFGKKKGLDDVLHKLTTISAIAFVLTSIYLSYQG